MRGERPSQWRTRIPIPDSLWNLMTQCWDHHYKARPQASEVAAICESCQKAAATESKVAKGKRRMQPHSTTATETISPSGSSSSSDKRSQDSDGSLRTARLSSSRFEASSPPNPRARPSTPGILRHTASPPSSTRTTTAEYVLAIFTSR